MKTILYWYSFRFHSFKTNKGPLEPLNHNLVRSISQEREAGSRVQDRPTTGCPVPYLRRDVEHLVSERDPKDVDGVEGRDEIEIKRGGSCGGCGFSRAEDEIVGDVFVGEMVNEAVGEFATEEISGFGSEGVIAKG